jgi:hypothetical protein
MGDPWFVAGKGLHRNLSYNLITRWSDKNIFLDTRYRRRLESGDNHTDGSAVRSAWLPGAQVK